jgi:hypothetical protein
MVIAKIETGIRVTSNSDDSVAGNDYAPRATTTSTGKFQQRTIARTGNRSVLHISSDRAGRNPAKPHRYSPNWGIQRLDKLWPP